MRGDFIFFLSFNYIPCIKSFLCRLSDYTDGFLGYSKKTVVVSLWNDLATNVGQELLDMADQSPVVAIKSLKVGEFQGTEFWILRWDGFLTMLT